MFRMTTPAGLGNRVSFSRQSTSGLSRPIRRLLWRLRPNDDAIPFATGGGRPLSDGARVYQSASVPCLFACACGGERQHVKCGISYAVAGGCRASATRQSDETVEEVVA
jgi:hypothetical protein